jgi:glutamate decarboxylase
MLCARARDDPSVLLEGSDGRNLVAFVSAETHYSCLAAANVMGIGYNNVVKIECNEHGQMRTDKLEEAILTAKS